MLPWGTADRSSIILYAFAFVWWLNITQLHALQVQFLGLPGQNRTYWRTLFNRRRINYFATEYHEHNLALPILCFDELVDLNEKNLRGFPKWSIDLDAERSRDKAGSYSQFQTWNALREQGLVLYIGETDQPREAKNKQITLRASGDELTRQKVSDSDSPYKARTIVDPSKFYFRKWSRLFFAKRFDPAEQRKANDGGVIARCWGSTVSLNNWLMDPNRKLFRWVLKKRRYVYDNAHLPIGWIPLKFKSPKFEIIRAPEFKVTYEGSSSSGDTNRESGTDNNSEIKQQIVTSAGASDISELDEPITPKRHFENPLNDPDFFPLPEEGQEDEENAQQNTVAIYDDRRQLTKLDVDQGQEDLVDFYDAENYEFSLDPYLYLGAAAKELGEFFKNSAENRRKRKEKEAIFAVPKLTEKQIKEAHERCYDRINAKYGLNEEELEDTRARLYDLAQLSSFPDEHFGEDREDPKPNRFVSWFKWKEKESIKE